jgi:hypothetical protein
MASRVSRLMVNPEDLHQEHPADEGQGDGHHRYQAERREPRNKKMMTTTISRVSLRVLITSRMALLM